MPRFTILTLLALFTFFNVQGQIRPVCLSAQPSENCADACIHCNLDGYIGINNGVPSGGDSLCNGNIIIHNAQWFAFIAADTAIFITILSSNCETGDGLQAALLEEDCNTALDCNMGSVGGGETPLFLSYFNLIPGKTYLLFIDGFSADVCDYEIQVTPSNAIAPPVVGQADTLVGPEQMCPGMTAWFQLPKHVYGADVYTWTVPPGWQVNGDSSGSVAVSAVNGHGAWIKAGSSGGQVCVTPGNQCYGNGETICVNVAVGTGGLVYHDNNSNGLFDPGELAGAGLPVLNTTKAEAILTDSVGIYSLQSPLAGDTLVLIYNLKTVGVVPGFHIIDTTVRCYDFAILPPPGQANGLVYWDLNCDSIFNAGDELGIGYELKAGTLQATKSSAKGEFQFNGLSEGDTIALVLPKWAVGSVPDFYTYKTTKTGGYDFAIVPGPVPASGHVFFDYNQNGVYDHTIDAPAAAVTVYTNAGALTATTLDGLYELEVVPSKDTIRLLTSSIAQPEFHTVALNHFINKNFALKPDFQNKDLALYLNHLSIFRPGFDTDVTALIQNNQAPIANATAFIVIPSWLVKEFITPAPTTIHGDTLYWNLGVMATGEIVKITIRLVTPFSTPIGTEIKLIGQALPVINDASPLNNRDDLQSFVQGAYDPNDKQVIPREILPSAFNHMNNRLEYTIRFQNTGNYPADFVKLIDTLSADFDMLSFEFLGSSHPCIWRIDPGRILTVNFNNINLPDSTTNWTASHGFFKFGIRPKTKFPLGYQFRNYADIYFDFNAPIRTNTAITRVVDQLSSIFTQVLSDDNLKVQPNPAVDKLLVSWQHPTAPGSRLLLYDGKGSLVTEWPVAAGERQKALTVMNRAGVYWMVLRNGKEVLYKMVILE